MIKELIETEEELRRDAESYEENIMDKLRPIFQVIKTEYLSREKEIINSEELQLEFDSHSTLDGYRLDGESIYLHYYDCEYDYYDCREFKMPLEVVEKELQSTTAGAVLEWYSGEVDKYLKKQKELQKKKEAEKEEKEMAELKRLQEKYKEKL